jgi:hypothetical protein
MKKFEASNQLDGVPIRDEIRSLTVSDGVVVNRDLSLGIALRLNAPDTSSMSSDEKHGIYDGFRRAINTLPANYDLEFRHVPIFGTKGLEAIYGAAGQPAGLVGDVVEETKGKHMAELRNQRLRFFALYVIIVRRFPLTIAERRKRTMSALKELQQSEDLNAGRMPSVIEKMSRAIENFVVQVGMPDKIVQYEENEYRDAVAELQMQSRSLAQNFQAVGYDVTICGNDETIEIFYQYWNRRRYDSGLSARPFREDADLPIDEYYVLSNYQWDPKGKDVPRGMYVLDGIYHKIVSLKLPPNDIGKPNWPHFEDMLLFSGPRKMEMIVKVQPGDRMKRLNMLKNEIRRQENAIETKKRPEDRETIRLEALRSEKLEIEQSLERTWKMATYFHLWGNTPEELDEASHALHEVANQLDIEVVEEMPGLRCYFRATQPFWTQDGDRYRLLDYSTRQLIGMLPLSGQHTYLSEKSPVGAVFETATGSLFNLFFHDPRRTPNAHVAICAGSRAGKSVLLDAVLMELKRYPLRCVIVDLGGSYRRFCQTLGGDYIEFDLKDGTRRMNPLYISGNRLPDSEELRSRVFTLEQMLCDHRKGERFTPEDMPQVAEALSLCYKANAGREIILSDLLAQFREMKLFKWATRLSDWCGEGSKGALFDGTNMLNLGNPVTVLDFFKVKDDPELAPVLFHIATNLAGQMAAGYPNDLKLLVYDEASALLRKPTTAEFIDQSIRTLAKNGVGVVTLSQNFGDFTALEITKETFVTNVSTWIFLRQDSTKVCEQIASEMRLSPAEQARLASLQTVFGEYSEFLCVQTTGGGRRSTHCYNVSTPLKYAMTTTAASDRAVFRRYEDEGLALPDAIRRFAQEYPRGADVKFAAA